MSDTPLLDQRAEVAYQKMRPSDPKLTALDARLAKQRARLKELWAEYRHKTDDIQINIGALERKIKAEECYLRRRITMDVAAGKVDPEQIDGQ